MPTRAQLSEVAEHQGGHTPLMVAALEGETATVKRLLSGGADVNERDEGGRTALMFAVSNRHGDCAKALLEHGADLNAKANDGATALILAVSSGDCEVVQDLLSKGADVMAKVPQSGKTAWEIAKEKGYSEIVRLLEVAGAKQ